MNLTCLAADRNASIQVNTQNFCLNSLKTIKPCNFLRYKALIRAGGRTRTGDLLITNQLLYQLSYASKFS